MPGIAARIWCARKSKIDGLLFQHQGALERLGVNGSDVFPQNPDEKKLNRRKEKNPAHDRCRPGEECLPEEQFVNGISNSHDKPGGLAVIRGPYSCFFVVNGRTEKERLIQVLRVPPVHESKLLLKRWDLRRLSAARQQQPYALQHPRISRKSPQNHLRQMPRTNELAVPCHRLWPCSS